MMKRISHLLALLLLLPLAAGAQKIVTIEGYAEVYGEKNDSPARCEDEALRLAILNALETEFGRSVTSSSVTQQIKNNDEESVLFDDMQVQAIKGEWLGEDGQPRFETEYDSERKVFHVKCWVKGKAREITNQAIDISLSTMRNSVSRQDNQFESGDALIIGFRAPISGYVALYLLDDLGNAFTLLPLPESTYDIYSVEKNKEYTFFDEKHCKFEDIGELNLYTDKDKEVNRIEAVFSPTPFSRPLGKKGDERTPEQLSSFDYRQWKKKCAIAEPRFTVKSVEVIINNNSNKSHIHKF